MRFPNAFNGSKKIFLAEILSLITSVLLIIGALVAVSAVKAETGDGAVGSLVGGGTLIIVGGIVAIVAFIIQIIGINACAKDEPAFKNALYAIIAGIIASVISSAVSASAPTVSSIFSAISALASLGAVVFVIKGFINLANQLGRSDVAASGKTVLYVSVGLLLLSVVLTFISGVITPSDLTSVNLSSYKTAQILSLIASVLSIGQTIVYLLFLKKSKDMLAA